MIPRARCPDCNRLHAVLERPAARSVARCSRCRRVWPPELEAAADVDALRCHEHPGRRTRWVCERCERPWCAPCGLRVRPQAAGPGLSPCCREGLLPVAPLQTLRPFWEELPAVMLYPLRGGSPFVLAFLFLGGFVPVLAWTIPVFAAAYAVHVTRRSASDPYTPPDFPEPDDVLTDFLYPLFRLLGASVIAWSPWLLYQQYGPGDRAAAVGSALLAVGLFVYPAIAMTSIVRHALFAALIPAELFGTAVRMGRDYLALVLAAAVFVLAWKATGRIAEGNDLLALAMSFTRYYLLIAIFHVLGRAVWQTRDRIDWGI